MNNSEHNFDHKLKRTLENYRAPYEPDDWLLMEQMLDQANKQPKSSAYLPILRNTVVLFSLAMLMLLSAGLLYQRIEQNSLNLALNQQAPTTGTSNSSLLPNNDYRQLPAITTFTPDNNTLHNTNAPTTIMGQTPPLQTTAANAIALQNGIKSNEQTTQNLATVRANLKASQASMPDNSTIAVTTHTTTNLPPPVAAATLPAQMQNMVTPAALNAHQPTQPYATKAALPPYLPTLSANLVAAQTVSTAKSLQTLQVLNTQTNPQPQPAMAPKLPPKQQAFVLAALTATDANWLQGAQQTGGFSGGFALDYQLSKHWSIGTGAMFSHKKWITQPATNNQQTDMSELTNSLPSDMWNNKEQNNIAMNLVELPVSVGFRFMPHKKISPYVRAGFSVLMPFKNMATYHTANYGSYAQTGMANQTVLANSPFDPAPRPNNNFGNDNDPLLATPIVHELENTDLPPPPNIYNSQFQNYWINSNPDFQSAMYANELIQIPQAPGINRPIWDVVHLTAGINYQIGQRWSLLAQTRLSSTITRHRLDAQLPVQLQPTQGQRLFSASMMVGFAYRFTKK